MLIAVSPYHLTTREPAAMAAMLLAEKVVTMLPAPIEGKEWGAVQRAAERIPRYLEFMQSWRWTMPLWQAGVIVSALEGNEAVDDIRPVCERIDAEERLSPLRSLMKSELFEDHERYLDALAHDLLRAGPDPGITVPVSAGLDEFATRHGAAVARPDPASVVQRAEAALGKDAFSVAIPILLQADAERMMEVREVLEPELQTLRSAITELISEESDDPGRRAAVTAAAKVYAAAFDLHRAELIEAREDDDVRMIEGTAALSGVRLPADAVLDSSLSAMRALSPVLLGRAQTNGSHAKTRPGVFSLFIRVVGRPARK